MPRKLRTPKERFEEISDELLAYLSDNLLGEEPDKHGLQWYQLQFDLAGVALRALWNQHGDEILAQRISTHPGTRPRLWWRFASPEPQRLRLGGTGTPQHEVLAYAESFHLGIPDNWVNQDDADLYNGRLRHVVTGERIDNGGKWFEGHFKGVAIDAANPPVFESQASYLDRHGLLLPEEKRRLKPRDFEPEVIVFAGEEVVI